jgi:hypothetical protein
MKDKKKLEDGDKAILYKKINIDILEFNNDFLFFIYLYNLKSYLNAKMPR